MKPEHICANHPTEEADSFCQHCHGWFCLRCLNQGPEYYYCNKTECHKAFEVATALKGGKCSSCGETVLPYAAYCGSCGAKLRELSAKEKADDLIVVARYQNPMEAYLAKARLESIDIESYIADEHIFAINPVFYAFGGVKLQVKKSDFDKAVNALDEKHI